MLPEVVRTGQVNVRERGFTSYFSVDGKSHNFSVRYYEDAWKEFPDHLKKRLAQMVSSVWVASIPSQEKVFTHRLNQADVDLLKFISYQTQGYYRRSMNYPSLTERPMLHITEGDGDWSDMELEQDECGLYFSGGRDAFCSLGLLEDAGYDVHIQMHNNGSPWDAGEKAREGFDEQERHIDTLWNNESVLKREITKDHKVFWHKECPTFFLKFFSSLPLLKQGLMFFGNEATTTRFTSVGKDRILNGSWEQSQTTTYLMTKWAQENGIELRVGSILREMGDYRVLKELVERWPDYWDLSISCFFVDQDNDYQPCSKCHKCFRNYLTMEAIGAEHKYDMERIRNYEIDPSALMWKTLLPNDMSHINEHNDGIFADVPSQHRPEIEGLMFKKDRANPAYFLSRDEFKRIYDVVRDDDTCWLVDDDKGWKSVFDLDEVYDQLEEWNVEDQFDFEAKVKRNNSLLNI